MRDELEKILRVQPAAHLDGDLLTTKVARIVPGASGALAVELVFPYPAASVGASACAKLRAALAAAGLAEVKVSHRSEIARRMAQGGAERIAGAANVIAVASAKGGVGKSLVAANLALALAAEGARAGLLDADIHGPSVARQFGGDKPQINEREQIVPHVRHGIQVLSMGHLVEPDQAVIWRGPMVVKALRQLLRETAWDGLDFLVLDLPPGTGDVALSIAQSTPVTGAIVVSTPQDLAIADALRGVGMFAKLSIPVLGYVANMASFVCPSCGAAHELFGAGAAEELGERGQLPLLAKLPLEPRVARLQEPALAADDRDAFAQLFRELATEVGVRLLARPIDRGASIPGVVAS